MLCNGRENLCDVRVDKAMWAGLHNGHSTDQDSFIAANHYRQLEEAVAAGFRGINVDIGKCNGEIVLLHSFCFLGSRDPVEVFEWIDTWLSENPNEVLLMPIQLHNEADGEVTLQEMFDMLRLAGNFLDKLYVHGSSTSFPTFQALIERGQQVLFFVYNGESCSSLGENCPRGFHDWFSFAGESRFSFQTVSEIEDGDYSCTVTRGSVGENKFYGLNMFLSIPSDTAARTLNSGNFMRNHIEACSSRYGGEDVNLVLVDFWSVGDTLAVVDDYNEAL